MRWSLPSFQEERSLNLSENRMGYYETNADINYMVEIMAQSSEDARAGLSNYAYAVGTPYARFLKQFTSMQAENKKIELAEAKKLTAQLVFKYIKTLGAQFGTLKDTETLHSGQLFNYIAEEMQAGKSGLTLDDKDCEFLVKYINREVKDGKTVKVCEAALEEAKVKKLAENYSR